MRTCKAPLLREERGAGGQSEATTRRAARVRGNPARTSNRHHDARRPERAAAWQTKSFSDTGRQLARLVWSNEALFS